MRTPRTSKRRSLRQVFAVPILIAIVSTFGLIVALSGDGWRDAMSWIALGVPILAAAWAWRQRG